MNTSNLESIYLQQPHYEDKQQQNPQQQSQQQFLQQQIIQLQQQNQQPQLYNASANNCNLKYEGTTFKNEAISHTDGSTKNENIQTQNTITSNDFQLPNSLYNNSSKITPNNQSSHTSRQGHEKIKRECVVCSDVATGRYFGAYVCVPCKTFFLRYANESHQFQCKFKKNCDVSLTTRTNCKYCRYKKCINAGMVRKVRPIQIQLHEGQQQCVVCSDVANGIHFGALTCEGCKKFFRRGLTEHKTYSCKNNQNCMVNPRTRNNCRFCRYQKCIGVGMSREAIQMGRPSKMNVDNLMVVPKSNQQKPQNAPLTQQNQPPQPQQQQQKQNFDSYILYKLPDGSIFDPMVAIDNSNTYQTFQQQDQQPPKTEFKPINYNLTQENISTDFNKNTNFLSHCNIKNELLNSKTHKNIDLKTFITLSNPSNTSQTSNNNQQQKLQLNYTLDGNYKVVEPETKKLNEFIGSLDTNQLINSTMALQWPTTTLSSTTTSSIVPLGNNNVMNYNTLNTNMKENPQQNTGVKLESAFNKASDLFKFLDNHFDLTALTTNTSNNIQLVLANSVSTSSTNNTNTNIYDTSLDWNDPVFSGYRQNDVLSEPDFSQNLQHSSNSSSSINEIDEFFEANDTTSSVDLTQSENGSLATENQLNLFSFEPTFDPDNQGLTGFEVPFSVLSAINPSSFNQSILTNNSTFVPSNIKLVKTELSQQQKTQPSFHDSLNQDNKLITTHSLPQTFQTQISNNENKPVFINNMNTLLQNNLALFGLDAFQIENLMKDGENLINQLGTEDPPKWNNELEKVKQCFLIKDDKLPDTLQQHQQQHHQQQQLEQLQKIHQQKQITSQKLQDKQPQQSVSKQAKLSPSHFNISRNVDKDADVKHGYFQERLLEQQQQNQQKSNQQINLQQQKNENLLEQKGNPHQIYEEDSFQQKQNQQTSGVLEDDLSKAETDYKVENALFEDGTPLTVLAAKSHEYWRKIVLPSSDTQWNYDNLLKGLIKPYQIFIAGSTILNQKLSESFEKWLQTHSTSLQNVSEFVEKLVVPEFTKMSVCYMKAIPGFLMFHPEDQKIILRLAQSPSRILAAAIHWFDDVSGNYYQNFLPWRRLPSHKDFFFDRLVEFARKIRKVDLDVAEECFFNIIIIIATDYPGLKAPEKIKKASSMILQAFRAYTTLRCVRGSKNTRLEYILSYAPELRHIGLLHHLSTTHPFMLDDSQPPSYSSLSRNGDDGCVSSGNFEPDIESNGDSCSESLRLKIEDNDKIISTLNENENNNKNEFSLGFQNNSDRNFNNSSFSISSSRNFSHEYLSRSNSSSSFNNSGNKSNNSDDCSKKNETSILLGCNSNLQANNG